MVTLIIKGDIAAAFEAADAHKVELIALATHNKFRECIASAPDAALGACVKWFCEGGDAPYPAGSLLFYSQPEN